MPQSSDQSANEREKFPEHFTFSQRYGYEPLPEPMRLEHLSEDLRREVFDEIYIFLEKIYRSQDKPTGINLEYITRILGKIKKIQRNKVNTIFSSVTENFEHILLKEENFNVILDCLEKMINESFSLCKKHIIEIRLRTRKISPNLHNFNEFIKSRTGNPLSLFDQYENLKKDAKSLYTQSKKFKDRIADIFKNKSAYELDTSEYPYWFFPRTSKEEGEAVQQAIKVTCQGGIKGAVTELRNAAKFINTGDHSGSIRESIHAVESIARTIDPASSRSLGPALTSLEDAGILKHKALKEAFIKLYGYTSDEKGLRHALLDKSSADVGLDEAIFMFGACASFAAYLSKKHQTTGRA